MNKRMAIILIIIGGLMLIVGMFIALKTIKPLYFNLIVGLMILIGTGFALFGKQLQDKGSSEKSDRIMETGINTNEKVNTLTTQNSELKTTLINLQKENFELHSKLASANKHIIDKITGGDSYCVVEPSFYSQNRFEFSLRLIGDTPLSNVQVTIQDLGRRLHLIEKKAANNFSSPLIPNINKDTSYGFEFPSLRPNTEVSLPISVEEEQNEIKLLIWIHLDNGMLCETLEVTNIRDEKKRNTKLVLQRGDEILNTN